MSTATSTSLCLHPSLPSRRSRPTLRLSAVSNRRRSLLLLLSLPAPFLAATVPPSRAADIGLFGIRKKLEKIEQEAVEVVKEGEQLVEKEIKTAEKEIESAAAAVEAEAEVAGAGFQIAGDLVQAGALVGAEAVGVLVGLSVVNGILSPESQK